MADEGSRALPRIAFVYGDPDSASHVREAIAGHAEIAYAASAGEFDAAQLAGVGAAAALVNVDGGDWLEDVESRLEAAGVPVVFNDPDISQQLEGWDRARWLRHLTAKLAGSDDFDPPRPPQAPAANDAAPGPVQAAAGQPEPEAADEPAQAANEPGPPASDAADGTVQASDAAGSAVGQAWGAPAGPALGSDHPSAVSEPMVASHPVAMLAEASHERPLSPHEIETLTAEFGGATEAAADDSDAGLQPAPLAQDHLAAGSEPNPVESMMSSPESEPSPEAAGDAQPLRADDAGGAGTDEHEDPVLDVDTEALSAMIDARLAEPERADAPEVVDVVSDPTNPPAHEQRPSEEEKPSATSGQATVSRAGDPDDDIVDSLPSLDDWQLLDPDAPPVSADPPASVKPPEPAFPDSLAGIELVPMDSDSPILRDSDPIERWIDETEGRVRAKDRGGKA